MPKPLGKRPSPLSLRLTAEERKILEQRAGTKTVSAYVKEQLFGVERPSRRTTRRVPAERVLLAQLLGQLGASGLAASMARLAKAADTGSLYVDDLVTRRLHDACDDLRGMHLHLLKALGKKLPNATPRKERLTVQFSRAAADIEDEP